MELEIKKPAKVFRWAFLLILITGVTVAGTILYPKYAGRLVFFGIFLFLDFLTLPGIRYYASTFHKFFKALIFTWYWLPVTLFIFFIAASSIWQIQDWPAFFRIYYPGILIPLFLSKFIFILLLLLQELFLLPYNLFVKIRNMKAKKIERWFRSRAFISTGLIISIIPALLMISGFFFWVYDFKIHQVEIYSKELPKSFDGFKIVQLSDIHLGSWISEKPFNEAISMVNAEKPDAIFFTGDLVNYVTEEAYPFEKSLRTLKAVEGVYSIKGNHDYGDYVHWKSKAEHELDNLALEQFYHELGWHFLNNSHSFVRRGNDSIAILGVENWSENKIWGQRGDMKKAYEGTDKVPVKLLLSHDPTHWDAEIIKLYPDILLTLSGHTHAMQMGWETSKYRFSPAVLLFKRWGGLYDFTPSSGVKQYLYVNRGLGHLGFPGRIGIRPEITVIVLKRQE
jgi:uncharacterized protein